MLPFQKGLGFRPTTSVNKAAYAIFPDISYNLSIGLHFRGRLQTVNLFFQFQIQFSSSLDITFTVLFYFDLISPPTIHHIHTPKECLSFAKCRMTCGSFSRIVEKATFFNQFQSSQYLPSMKQFRVSPFQSLFPNHIYACSH